MIHLDNENLQRKALVRQLQAGHETSHLLHFFISLITLGWWIPGWIIVALVNSSKRKRIAQEHGVVM